MENITYEKEITGLLVIDPYSNGPLLHPERRGRSK